MTNLTEFPGITFGVNDHLGIEECPSCGSSDLACCGWTEERTDNDVTDVIECEACDWSWERSGGIS